jgi:hypothetical protein
MGLDSSVWKIEGATESNRHSLACVHANADAGYVQYGGTIQPANLIIFCPEIFLHHYTIAGSVDIVVDKNPEKSTRLNILTLSRTMLHEFVHL